MRSRGTDARARSLEAQRTRHAARTQAGRHLRRRERLASRPRRCRPGREEQRAHRQRGCRAARFRPRWLAELYPASQLSLGQRAGAALAVELESGELSFRPPRGSGLQLHTPNGVVRASDVVAIASGGGAVESLLRVEPSGETVVRVRNGIVGVNGAASPTFSRVGAGSEPRIFARSRCSTSRPRRASRGGCWRA